MQHTYQAIIGPTAVGKSDRALELAQELVSAGAPGLDIISVDSKQVYRGLEILTGADVSAQFHLEQHAQLPPYFANANQSIRLHGISIIEPSEEWSVAHFQLFARSVVHAAEAAGRTPLFVGGTGLYYAHLFSDDAALHVGPDEALRAQLGDMPVSQVQALAQHEAPEQYAQLNQSDVANPRRLIRLIEKSRAGMRRGSRDGSRSVSELSAPPIVDQPTFEYLGLTADLPTLEARIQKRVGKRFEGGAVEEVARLLARPDAAATALSTLGVADLRAFLQGEITQGACQERWALHEFQYAKRQLTWWKKYPVRWLKTE